MNRVRVLLSCALAAGALASPAQAVLITFTGGTVYRFDSTTQTTNNLATWDNVSYYEESGYRFTFYSNSGGFSSHVGNYYGANNDVIHAHWLLGGLGGVTLMEITQIAPGTFDLNYFTLTSNTFLGGAPANGTEQTWVQGYFNGNPTGPAVLLPSENWGFPATQVGLGPDFDAVDSVRFFVTSDVDCFGMDDFFINEIPAPSTLAAGALFGAMAMRRRR